MLFYLKVFALSDFWIPQSTLPRNYSMTSPWATILDVAPPVSMWVFGWCWCFKITVNWSYLQATEGWDPGKCLGLQGRLIDVELWNNDWRRYSQLWKIPSPCNFKRMQVRVMNRHGRSWPWYMDIEKNIDRAVMKKSIFRVKKRWQAARKNLAMQTKNWISQTSKTVKSFKNWGGESGVYYKDEFLPIELRVCTNVIAIKQPDRADGR